MPKFTPHYLLSHFEDGEAFSASHDRRRFSIIDNQFSFIADQIGDGIIDGWEITTVDSGSIKISPGTAIIDGFFTKTYGNIILDVDLNKRFYLYMRRLGDIVSQVSSFSDTVSVEYLDEDAPSQPETPTIEDKSFNFIKITWTNNPENDIDFYKVFRSPADTSDFVEIAETEENYYEDSDVEQNTSYIYKIKSIDVNGFSSVYSEELEASTDIDTRIPGDPSGVITINGNATIQVYWDQSNFLAEGYEITLTPISLFGEPLEDGIVESVNKETFSFIFSNLNNGQLYEIVIKTVSISGIKSNGIIGRATPFYSNGATEIQNISVSPFVLDNTTYRVALNISWELQNEEYSILPDHYLITVFRENEEGVPSIYFGENITLYRYSIKFGNTTLTRNFQENTTYTIKIQTVSGDVISNGFIYKIKIPKFKPPEHITNLNFETEYSVNKRLVLITWDNSVSEFAFNRISVRRVSLNDEYGTITTIHDSINYGHANSLQLKPSDIYNSSRYEIDITPVDTYGNTGNTVSGSTVISVPVETITIGNNVISDASERPPVPSQQYGIAGDDENILYWNSADSEIIEYYRIYRSEFETAILPSDFEMIAEVPSTVRRFRDYQVENDITYAYFVTSVDVFGNESLNPEDGYFSYPMVLLMPHSYLPLSKPNVLNAEIDGFDVVLSWEPTLDSFDGHEIYRSIDNLYSFEFVGSTNYETGEFVDTDALKKSGSYYYILRKYVNEAEIYSSRNNLPPAGSLLIGLVSRNSNGISINSSDRFIIKGLEGPVTEEISKQLNITPAHLYFSRSDDRRIRLQNDLYVPSNLWTTTDFQTYTTEVGLASTNNYVVYINGLQSAFNTKVDISTNTLTFDRQIFDPLTEENEPKVSAIFKNVYETTGTLPSKNIENIYANRVTRGILTSDRIPQISHLGRHRETLIPVSNPCTRIDAYSQNAQIVSGLTFYDIIQTTDNLLMAATSQGIRVTSSDSPEWTTILSESDPAVGIFYSEYLDMYFSILKNKVMYSTDKSNWFNIAGMTGVSCIRGITEDSNGTIFVSTDSGIFYSKPLTYTSVFWTQFDAFDDLDSNAYGIFYYDDELFISGTNGIFVTNDLGETWERIDNDSVKVPCYSIFIQSDYIFAVSNNRVWRKHINDPYFDIIGDFSFPCRKGVIFNDNLYITTDKGLYSSVSSSNIFSDDSVEFDIAFSNLSRNTIMPVVYGLRKSNNKLWLGLDERIYSVDNNNSIQIHVDDQIVSPTIFVDNVERSVGVYYSTQGRIIFDTPLLETNKCSITTQYTEFSSPNGGWANSKFDANVIIAINSNDIIGPEKTELINGRFWRLPPDPFKVSSDPNFLIDKIKQMQTPFFNGRTANFDKAQESLTRIVQITDSIQTLADDGETTTPSSLVADLFNEIDLFKSYLQPELRPLITCPPITGSFSQSGYSVEFDCVTGNITITGPIGKYTLCQITVEGVYIINDGEFTHNEIEDTIEKTNSGLPIGLAMCQQANVLKAGIHHHQYNAYDLVDRNLDYQIVHNSVCDDNWYNILSSTLDYEEKLSFDPHVQGEGYNTNIGFSIEYPSDVKFISEIGEVWICGDGGIISVDSTSHEVEKVLSSEFYFYSIDYRDGQVYAVAEDGLYVIDINTKIATKEIDLTLPQRSRNIFVGSEIFFLSAQKGIYSKRPFEFDWTLTLEIEKSKIISSSPFVFAIGKDPNNTNNSIVYYSYEGAVWYNTKFTDINVFSVTHKNNLVYYATNSGLIVEDLTRLFQQQTFSGPNIFRIHISDNDESLLINDIDATEDGVVVATENGDWHMIEDNLVVDSGDSSFQTIHKIRLINGEIWLFSNNNVEIVEENKIIRLSTGIIL